MRADEIAVSVPDIENYAAYIKENFILEGFLQNSARVLSWGLNKPANFFPLFMIACKIILLLNLWNLLFWINTSLGRIGRGWSLNRLRCKNNCAVSWKENKEDTVYKNIWIESFKINYERDEIEVEQKKKREIGFIVFIML